jgi:rod shape-determining protein MreD
MRPPVLLTIIVIAALLLQTTLLPLTSVGRATPDLLLIICVYLGLHQHTVAGAVGAFVLGYLQDSFSGSVVGLNAFGMSLVFALVYLTSRRLWVDNAMSKIVVVFLASVLKTGAMLGLIAIFLSAVNLWHTVVQYLLIEAALAAVLSPAVFALLAFTQRVAVAEEE